MLTANTDELEKSLAAYKAEVERKLKAMVVGFAQDVALAASESTRKGHISEGGNTLAYVDHYKQRKELHNIDPIEGYHKGAWQYSEGQLTFNESITPVGTMVNEVGYQAEANYKIGDTFYIGATGPAFEMLQGLDDIQGNAESTIQRAYQSNLKSYYDEG